MNLARHSKRRYYEDRLSDFRIQYAKTFGIDPNDVQGLVWPDGDMWIWSDKHSDLPRWTTGDGYR